MVIQISDDGFDYSGLTIAAALRILKQNGFTDDTEKANRQNKANSKYVFVHPTGIGVYYCDSDQDVIELVECEGLTLTGS